VTVEKQEAGMATPAELRDVARAIIVAWASGPHSPSGTGDHAGKQLADAYKTVLKAVHDADKQ
jgi:hypothetical protein